MTTEQADPWTVIRLLQWTTEFFKKRGSESARLDAEVLLAEARGCSRIELYTAFNEEPPPEVREAFRELVRRRGDGTPVAYLVGHKEFYSLDFRVSEATLIPRPETEHVVIEALDHAKRLIALSGVATTKLLLADVGTGSGAIAISVAKNLPHCQMTAIDLSPEALEIAKYNVQNHGLANRVNTILGDCLQPLPAEPHLHIICSNPPYVTEAEYEVLSKEVRKFEPRMALVSGPTGTEIIARLIEQASQRLVAGGQLIFELSPMIADPCIALLRDSKQFNEPKFIRDLAGHRRVLSATKLPNE